MTGDHDHLALRVHPFESLQDLYAIHPRQPDIEEGDVWFLLLENLNRLFSALCLSDSEPFVLQNTLNRLNDALLVVHDEDFLIHHESSREGLASPISQPS